ncbi:MAG: class I SAM-dependent methyltransferase [Pseudomonadota bacterium]|nr:class I SAM-dependent methyltransferase [Pseudomonadota bacterium]
MLISECARKIFNGETPSDDEWSNHLISVHRLVPSMTPNAFAGFQTRAGLNSYEVLADTIGKLADQELRVLDLGCGDGHLIGYFLPQLASGSQVLGIDISDAELEIARASYREPLVSFINAKAQSLPVEDASQDVILCHMAFVLMRPIESVVKEISRVLKPGGVFSAVTGNPRSRQVFWGEVQGFIFEFIDSRFPKVREANWSDGRVNTEDGLKTLFSKQLEFSQKIEREDIELQIEGSPENVWQITKDMYLTGMLPVEQKRELEIALKSFVEKHPLVSKGQSFGFPLSKFTVTSNK